MAVTFRSEWSGPPEVDVGGRQVGDALVISQVIVVSDEGLDLGFEIAWAGNKEYRYGYTQGK